MSHVILRAETQQIRHQAEPCRILPGTLGKQEAVA